MSTQPKSYLTPEEYLAIERKAQFKSEYWNGEMYAMSGARRAHNVIAFNSAGALAPQLRGKPCEAYVGDMRVRTTGGLYTYPDLVVVCGEPRFVDGEFDTLVNPSLIVEILSPSTEAYDRGEKFEQYRTIDSLTEYLTLASTRIHADLYIRQPNGDWLLRVSDKLEDAIELASCGCTLRLAEIYEKVEFVKSEASMRPARRNE
jgi:Uma2 family endonuclease